MSFYNNIKNFRVLHYYDDYQLINIDEIVWNPDKTRLLKCVQYDDSLPVIDKSRASSQCMRCACAKESCSCCFACEEWYNGEDCVLVPIENS